MLIRCPICGPREEPEFSYGGPADVSYPASPDALDDREWGAFLYVRRNADGPLWERWYHGGGCHRWFRASRDTRSNTITESILYGGPDS